MNNITHPGTILEETMIAYGLSQVELAARIGLSRKQLNMIINEKASITPETAIRLSRIFEISSDFWINLESNYQHALAIEEDLNHVLDEKKYLPHFSFYKDMANFGWVEKTINQVTKVRNLLNFFAVNSLKTVIDRDVAIEFRIADKLKASIPETQAWLRQGEIAALKSLPEYRYNKTLLTRSLDEIKKLSQQPITVVYKQVKEILKKAGVVLIGLPNIPRSPVNGALIWIQNETPVIILSLRNCTEDIFWFTLFHELGHLIIHDKNKNFIDEISQDDTQTHELEANEFAKNTLIPSDMYEQFIQSGIFSLASIKEFANKIQIAHSIVAGRLAKEDHVQWSFITPLRPRYKFKVMTGV